jgi:hypothetical protein
MNKFFSQEIAMSHATICHSIVASDQPDRSAFATRFMAELTRLLAQMSERR